MVRVMRLAYPVRLERHPDTVIVTFPDIPEALTEGATEDEALAEAKDCLVAALGGYVQDGRPIPAPSQGVGTAYVALPALVAAKVAFYQAVRARLRGGTTFGCARTVLRSAYERDRSDRHRQTPQRQRWV